MTTPTHAAALVVARDSLRMLRAALDGMPPEMADWAPAPNTNSVNVLVAHSIAATRFFMGLGCGRPGSITQYRREDRARAFEARGSTPVQMMAAVEAFSRELEDMLAGGSPADLERVNTWRDEGETEIEPSGMEALFRAVGHLREHVGQVQLMRDLWAVRP